MKPVNRYQLATQFRELAANAQDYSISIWADAERIADEIETGEHTPTEIDEFLSSLTEQLEEAKAE